MLCFTWSLLNDVQVSFLIWPYKASCNFAETSHYCSRPFTSKYLSRLNSNEATHTRYVCPATNDGGQLLCGGYALDALDTYMVGVIFTASLSVQCQTFSFNRLINHLCHSLSNPSLKLLRGSSATVFCQYLGVLTRKCKFHYLVVAEPEKGLIWFNEHSSPWMLMKSNNVSKMDPRKAGSVYHLNFPFLNMHCWVRPFWPVFLGYFTLSTFHFLLS